MLLRRRHGYHWQSELQPDLLIRYGGVIAKVVRPPQASEQNARVALATLIASDPLMRPRSTSRSVTILVDAVFVNGVTVGNTPPVLQHESRRWRHYSQLTGEGKLLFEHFVV